MSGTSLEVSGSGADQGLACANDALAAAPADTAVRVHHDSSCLHKGLDNSFLNGSFIDFVAGRYYQEANQRMYLSAADQVCADTQIAKSAVVAGT